MFENITDIKKWNDVYPFLEEVLNTYMKFDNKLEDYNRQYDVICDYYILKNSNDYITKYSQFCKKLMRNLGHLSVVPQNYEFTQARCNILYYWIYNSIKKGENTSNILNQCIDEYNTYMNGINNEKRCYHFLYDKIYEPIKVTLLDIFNDNTHIIERILKSDNENSKIPCRKFVCECLKIYKYMNETYCLNPSEQSQKYTETCLKLRLFSIAYNIFHKKFVGIDRKIPSLDNIDSVCLDSRLSDDPKSQLISDTGDDRGNAAGMRMNSSGADINGTLEQNLPEDPEISVSSMKKHITTTIGTFAGASSLLALLYKFTPAGRLVKPKLRRTTGIINNNFYGKEANGMLFGGNEHNGFNSYNIGYEAI